MLMSMSSIFGAIRNSGLLGSLLASMRWEEKRYKGTTHNSDLSSVTLHIGKFSFEKYFEVSAYARCTDSDRTGFSMSNRPQIYNAKGFQTFEGAFGFLTEQVDQAQKEFQSTYFRFYPEEYSTLGDSAEVYEYDALQHKWKPFPLMIFKCDRCDREISGDETRGFTIDVDFLCDKCAGTVSFHRYT